MELWSRVWGLGITLRTLNYGNDGLFLIMGNAEFGSAPQVDPCVSTFLYLAIHDMVLVQQPSERNARFLQVQVQFVKLCIC